MNSKGELTPGEYLAMNISGRMDELESRLDAAIQKISVDIKLDLMEVDILLSGIEECDRKWPRVKPQQGGAKR
jgi:hypothetical protein